MSDMIPNERNVVIRTELWSSRGNMEIITSFLRNAASGGLIRKVRRHPVGCESPLAYLPDEYYTTEDRFAADSHELGQDAWRAEFVTEIANITSSCDAIQSAFFRLDLLDDVIPLARWGEKDGNGYVLGFTKGCLVVLDQKEGSNRSLLTALLLSMNNHLLLKDLLQSGWPQNVTPILIYTMWTEAMAFHKRYDSWFTEALDRVNMEMWSSSFNGPSIKLMIPSKDHYGWSTYNLNQEHLLNMIEERKLSAAVVKDEEKE